MKDTSTDPTDLTAFPRHSPSSHFLPFKRQPTRTDEIQSALARLYLRFAEQQAWLAVPDDASERAIHTAAVVGTGVMATGIAIALAHVGIAVRFIGRSDTALAQAQQRITQHYAKRVQQGRLSPAAALARGHRIRGTTAQTPLSDVEIVIEAVCEQMEVKKEIFRKLGQHYRSDTVFASCTSALDLNPLADASGRPEQVIGCHFLNPAYAMRALEIVQTDHTSPVVVEKTLILAQQLGKIPLLVRHNPQKPGFVGNRLLRAYLREAEFLVEEGAVPQQVDHALTAFGMVLGPFAMSDMAGLDVGWYSRQYYADQRPPHERYSTLCDELCERGRFGQKTGAGWYRYSAGGHAPFPDPDVDAWIHAASRRLGITRRCIEPSEIIQRCIGALSNEAAQVVAESLVKNAYIVDLLWIYGYGFPSWRGGPLFYADTVR